MPKFYSIDRWSEGSFTIKTAPIIIMDISYIKIGSNHNGTSYSLAITKIPAGRETGNL